MRIALAAASLLASLTLAHAEEKVDGKVKSLNPDTFAVLKANASPRITLGNARAIAAAIAKPRSGEASGRIDEKERDLLNELTQSSFRRIVVTMEGNDAAELVTYPASAEAKFALRDVLEERPDFDAAWVEGSQGYGKLVAYYKKSERARTDVLAFVKQKMKVQMDVSDMKNAYKPLRDEISRLYGHTGKPGADAPTGRTILYKTMSDLDFESYDKLPDFLYSWIKPADYRDPAPRPTGMQRVEDYNKH
jgi:hypothetical protein